MSQRKLSRVASAGFLVALLTLPTAASARVSPRSSSFSALEWIGSLWERGISLVQQGVGAKQGYGIDPNGKPAAQTGTDEAPASGDGATTTSIDGGGNG